MATTPLISIVDDDETVRDAITSLMSSLGFTVKAFPSAVDFLAWPKIGETCCLIADVQMPHMTGLELHTRLLENGHAIPTILISAFPEEGAGELALSSGVVGYLNKPCGTDVLIGCVRSALARATAGKAQP